EEAKYADIILNVCDIASEDRDIQLAVTTDVLAQIGCEMENVITVYNKYDKEHDEYMPAGGVITSAKSGYGLDSLLKAIDDKLSERMADLDLLLPYSQTGLINTIRENGRVDSEEYTAEGIAVKGKVDKKFLYIFTSYQLK
ncbi:MAG: GTPase HflX, partial [Oscillospiraceae bacterium]|nr:GTPase HflX [Oscillospiraceae bacterium]